MTRHTHAASAWQHVAQSANAVVEAAREGIDKMGIESIELSDAAKAVIVKMCGYTCYSKHLPETRAQITAARVELRKEGLVGNDGLDTNKAHTYVDSLLFY